MKKILSILMLLSASLFVNAQIDIPVPSPGATLIQKFGLTEIKIDYSRPSVNGRTIFGTIVPFDSIWRTGANEPTSFTTKDAITVNGQSLAKGTYIILTRPGKTSWEVIFNKNPLVSYTNYKPQDDVLKINVPITVLTSAVETFTISTNNIKTDNCILSFEWQNTSVKLNLVNDVRTKVLKQIKQKIDGPTQSEFTTMARFYFENGESVTDALKFIQKAVDMGETFSNLRLQSLILAKSGDKKQAVIVAKKSLEKATAANNQDYIRMNNQSIIEWTK